MNGIAKSLTLSNMANFSIHWMPGWLAVSVCAHIVFSQILKNQNLDTRFWPVLSAISSILDPRRVCRGSTGLYHWNIHQRWTTAWSLQSFLIFDHRNGQSEREQSSHRVGSKWVRPLEESGRSSGMKQIAIEIYGRLLVDAVWTLHGVDVTLCRCYTVDSTLC